MSKNREKPTQFKDARGQAFTGVSEDEIRDTTRELTLEDLKGSRASRDFPEWQPKGRQPGEDTTGQGAPAPPQGRRSIGAGPGGGA